MTLFLGLCALKVCRQTFALLGVKALQQRSRYVFVWGIERQHLVPDCVSSLFKVTCAEEQDVDKHT